MKSNAEIRMSNDDSITNYPMANKYSDLGLRI